jgi:hypothetical protein
MFVNRETNLKTEDREREIDQEIEALKEKHPLITKEEYWSALKRAKISYGKLKEIIASIQVFEAGKHNFNDSEKIQAKDNLRLELVSLFMDCKNVLQADMKALAELMDDPSSYYFFMPTERPLLPGGTNPIFGAEDYGIPELLPAALVLTEEYWLKVFPETKYFDEKKEHFCTDVGGVHFFGEGYNEDNILSALGLEVINGSRNNSKINKSIRHEGIHAVDFLRGSRVGENRIITELIAHRIDGKIVRRKKNKEGDNPLNVFFNDLMEGYADSWRIDNKVLNEAAQHFKELVFTAEKTLDFSAVTQLLLNSVSIDEFEQAVNQYAEEHYEK